jgi:hypothetical protein
MLPHNDGFPLVTAAFIHAITAGGDHQSCKGEHANELGRYFHEVTAKSENERATLEYTLEVGLRQNRCCKWGCGKVCPRVSRRVHCPKQ